MSEFSKLVALNHVEPEIPFGNVSQVTYGKDDQNCVIAASVHFYDPSKRAFWIQFSAVAEAHRNRGAYKELHSEVQRLAKRAGAINIYTGVSVINDGMLEVARKMNRTPMVVRFKIPIGE